MIQRVECVRTTMETSSYYCSLYWQGLFGPHQMKSPLSFTASIIYTQLVRQFQREGSGRFFVRMHAVQSPNSRSRLKSILTPILIGRNLVQTNNCYLLELIDHQESLSKSKFQLYQLHDGLNLKCIYFFWVLVLFNGVLGTVISYGT